MRDSVIIIFMISKQILRKRRKKRIRIKIKGTKECPRISVFRSNRFMRVQVIDDAEGKTLFSGCDREFQKTKAGRIARAERLGEALAKKALSGHITRAVFDRSGYAYHGIVKAVADGARGGGLKI